MISAAPFRALIVGSGRGGGEEKQCLDIVVFNSPKMEKGKCLISFVNFFVQDRQIFSSVFSELCLDLESPIRNKWRRMGLTEKQDVIKTGWSEILQLSAKQRLKTTYSSARQSEEEVGRQHQELDRPGVRQVPEGSREQEKIDKTGCEIIFGAQTTLAVKG